MEIGNEENTFRRFRQVVNRKFLFHVENYSLNLPSGIYPRKPKNHICNNCNSNTSRIENNSQHWYHVKDYWLCKKCYDSQRHKIYDRRIINYRGKDIAVDCFPRTGICSQCGYIGKTDLHHTEYDDSNPLAHTIELCKSCHIKATWELGQYNNKMNNFSLIMNRDKKTGRFIKR